jgi:hypothetical protein
MQLPLLYSTLLFLVCPIVLHIIPQAALRIVVLTHRSRSAPSISSMLVSCPSKSAYSKNESTWNQRGTTRPALSENSITP